MYDQSFNSSTLSRMLQIGDERKFPSIKFAPNKQVEIARAVEFAHTTITSMNPLSSFLQNGRTVFQAKELAHQLVLRKLGENLKQAVVFTTKSRESIVSNLIQMLSEGVPYRIYRLDIRSFYESFDKADVLERVNTINRLSPLTKKNIELLFSHHSQIGGLGVPRGLALSAVLSELMMKDFDEALVVHSSIYFSARYVDDIVILTSGEEPERAILKHVESSLPNDLKLNHSKTRIATFTHVVSPFTIPKLPATKVVEFNYLGYKLEVTEPLEIKKVKKQNHRRSVSVDIAHAKSIRTRTRITKSFLAFAQDKDFYLLNRRIRFLTSNFKVRDARTGRPNLAGIFYSYPLLTSQQQLRELDAYLRHAIFSSTGAVYSKTGIHLSSKQKRKLLSNSFVQGHKSRTFMHFNGAEIENIQECWKYE